MERTPHIEISQLTFTYATAEKPALKNINLTIYEGEYVALLGLNGAGKTTLLLTLNGVIPHMVMGDMEGVVTIAGHDTDALPVRELAKVVGIVFDNPEFQLSQLTVAEEVAFGLENLGVPQAQMHDIIHEVLGVVGLTGLHERSPFALSGGQQQRLAIASALVMRPQIFVMDEPTANVDPIGKEEIFQVARQLNQQHGMTVVISEHEVEVMAEYADRVIVLHEGEIVLNGHPREVFQQVKLLKEICLRVPQVTEMAYMLDIQGLWHAGDAYPITVAEALHVFAKYRKEYRI